MNRVAAVALMVFAVLLFVSSFYSPETWPFIVWAYRVVGVVALGEGVAMWVRNRAPRVVLVVFALLVLTRSLPSYFQTQELWPLLALIGASMCAFGFGLLAQILQRYQPDSAHRPEIG